MRILISPASTNSLAFISWELNLNAPLNKNVQETDLLWYFCISWFSWFCTNSISHSLPLTCVLQKLSFQLNSNLKHMATVRGKSVSYLGFLVVSFLGIQQMAIFYTRKLFILKNSFLLSVVFSLDTMGWQVSARISKRSWKNPKFNAQEEIHHYKITSLLQNLFRFLITSHIPLDRSNCEQGSNLDPNFK